MSQTIDAELVRHVAKLARIHVTDEQVARFGQQLGQILDYVQQLNELDVSDVQPLAHALDVHNVFRDDEPAESLPVELALREAPARDGAFFQVPQVLGEDGGA
jgi:aspartyl-tRNA(Asn)/glutamyl-tRNA(Gln) amidotransferase subunit C